MLFVEDQIAAFERVFLEIVEFVDVPDALITNEFIAIGTDGVLGRRLREVALPIVFVEELFAPFGWFTLRDGKPALAIESRGYGSAGNIENGWHDIETGDNLFDGLISVKEFGTASEHGDAHGFFVRGALIYETVFAEGKAVVAHVNHQCGLQFATRFDLVEDAAQAFIDGHESFAVASIVFGDVEIGVIRKIDAVPGITLILDPHRTMLGHFAIGCHGGRVNEFGVFVFAFVTVGRNEVGVNGFVGEIEEIGLLFWESAEPIECVISKLVGDVTLLRDMFAVDVQAIWGLGDRFPAL